MKNYENKILNPFQPSFGRTPPTLIGRSYIIDNFLDSLDEDVGDERRATLFTGQRGMGKTVVLNAIAEQAKERNWIVAEVTASKTMLDDIIDQIYDQVRAKGKTTFQGFNLSVFGFGAGVSTKTEQRKLGWRMQVTHILRELEKRDVGVLFSIDEIISTSDEIKQFATTYQHFVREDRKVAVAMAGLPFQISGLLQDKILTFLRRSSKVYLGNIAIDEVYNGMLDTITVFGREIKASDMQRAAEATHGYPYLIQLVGSKIWGMHPGAVEITTDDVTAAIPLACKQLTQSVIEPILEVLSDKDMAVLKAMSEDDVASKTSDISSRLHVTDGYLSKYRERLLDADVIVSPRRGYIDFNVPFLREHLRAEI